MAADAYYGLGLLQQYQCAQLIQQYQGIGGMGQAVTPLILNTLKPMPVEDLPNKLLLLVEEGEE